MQGFTEDQIKRQDFVDNQIYDLVKQLIPSTREIEWNIGRDVPRKPRFVGGVPCPQAGRGTMSKKIPCREAPPYGREASNDRRYQRYNPTLACRSI